MGQFYLRRAAVGTVWSEEVTSAAQGKMTVAGTHGAAEKVVRSSRIPHMSMKAINLIRLSYWMRHGRKAE